MRLARLDLLRYGRFTDGSIELPQAERDIHIVFGLNEAGKTTCLTAIEDLLFGIPHRSPYNFLHNYDAMRIGAVLEDGDACFEFQRRKTRRDMILGTDGNPLRGDERLLAPFLGGADRDYFDRMFNLSHSRLATGGRAIIEARDDVGQMLFYAGTGLDDVRECLKRLEEEADRIWAPRKSARRRYYQARDRLEDAQSRQRQHSLTVSAWKAARRTLNNAERTLGKSREEHEEKSRELKKLVRIRHVHGAVRQRRELNEKIAALGHVIVLAEDAAEQLGQAEKEDAKFREQVGILGQQLAAAQQALDEITFDDALVRRADDVVELNEQRIAVRRGQQDLPKRREEYRLALESLGRCAIEVGWKFEESSELIARIPPRSKVGRVRNLLARHGELEATLIGARKALEESREAQQVETERLEAIGEATDVSGLAAVLIAVRDVGDVEGQIRKAQAEAAQINKEIHKKLRSMKPVLPVGTDVEALGLPPGDTVKMHRDDVRDLAQRQAEFKQRLTTTRNDLQRDQEELERRARDEGIVGPDAVNEARRYRDTLWKLVKARYIECSEIPVEEAQANAVALEDLPASFEGAANRADSIADRRFDKAQASAELAVLARKIEGHNTQIRQMEAHEALLKAEGEQLDQAWNALWADVPVEELAPDVMLDWLEAIEEIVGWIAREREVQHELGNSKRDEQEALGLIRTALTKIGWNAEEIEAEALRVTVERADAYRREQDRKAEKIDDLRDAVAAAKSKVVRRQRDLEKANTERQSWQGNWARAIAAIDLERDGAPEFVSEKLNVIDEMREHAASARDLRDKRIATIERDIEIFERSVAEAAAELAQDLTDGDAGAAVVELDRRRKEALDLHRRYRELSDLVTERRDKIEELEECRKAAWVRVQPLLEIAGVDAVQDLREAIRRSDRLRTLKEELTGVMEKLQRQGDGLAIEVLEEECRDIDIDAARAREETVESEIEELGKQRDMAIESRADARRAYNEIGGDDAAARAAADCEAALATMQNAAERYVRVKMSAMLLRWAVDRYRKEKQGPLLKRASELFRVLTLNSFERLEVTFDERDAMRLTGLRSDGEVVPVQGLSSGTEDQLFLALRVAAVEDYLGRAVALPFVADDLFINFDPKRSAAGFEVLGQLAERTQVLFYTHHPHLVDVAQETLGADVHVVTLGDAA